MTESENEDDEMSDSDIERKKKDLSVNEINKSSWMSELKEKLGDKLIRSTVIPGTHDSGAYKLSPNSPLAPDAPEISHKLSHSRLSLANLFNDKVVKKITSNWANAQERSILEQLNDGIRYLDLRICRMDSTNIHTYQSAPSLPRKHNRNNNNRDITNNESDNIDELIGDNDDDDQKVGFYVCHGLRGDSIHQILDEILEFTRDHSKEVIFLDFNHFYNMNCEEDHQLFQTILFRYLADHLCPNTYKVKTMTFNSIWSINKQIILFYHHQMIIDKCKSLFWTAKRISSPWADQISTSQLIKSLEKNLKAGLPANQFYVTQCILTPRPSTIVNSIAPSTNITSLRELSFKSNQRMFDWIFSLPPTSNINILIIDHYHYTDYVNLVLNYNLMLFRN